LASTLSLYEKIRMNELIQSATFDDRYKILEGEQYSDKWTQKFEAMVPEERNFIKAMNERKMVGTGNGSWLLIGEFTNIELLRLMQILMALYFYRK
jgi:hypothetical protein